MRSSVARTVLLGCIATVAGIWWLGRAYDVEASAMLGYLLGSVVFVVVTAVAGIVGAAVLWLVKRIRK